LTGLYNRRYFMNALALELRRSRRYGLGLSVLMLDLDGFKALNDRHGHLFGDLVLERVGQTLRRAVREADRACRFGGEEFSVILPETERLGAHALGERIRGKMQQAFARATVRGERTDVRLSGGIATYPDDGLDAPTLLARADEALYRAKRQGGDRIALFHAERRGAVRYPARPAACTSLRLGNGLPLEARPVNFSVQGALVEVDEPCPPDVRVEVVFDDPRAAFGGRVVRVEPASAVGRRRVAIAFDEPLPEACLIRQVQRAPSPRAWREGRA
jgi:diguanylate cyclase (GGDEF)-like protein